MSELSKASEPLAAELDIALNYTPAGLRPRLHAFLVLDRRLAQIVSQTTEPMLGQMRLAWWRDMLGKGLADRPQGDAALDAIGAHWTGDESVLIRLVDGWEEMLAEPPLPIASAKKFSEGRAAGFAALDQHSPNFQAISEAASAWALTDAALHLPDGEEREMLMKLASSTLPPLRLPRSHRGLAVLVALAQRARKIGAKHLLEGRGAALLALKVGLLGS